MGLAPVDTADQLQPGRVGLQPQVQTHATGTELAPQHQMRHQGALIEPLQGIRTEHTQGLRSVVRRKIPGIPEFAPVPIALQLQGRRQLIPSIAIPQSQQSGRGDIELDQTIAHTPSSRPQRRDDHSLTGLSSTGRQAWFTPERHRTNPVLTR